MSHLTRIAWSCRSRAGSPVGALRAIAVAFALSIGPSGCASTDGNDPAEAARATPALEQPAEDRETGTNARAGSPERETSELGAIRRRAVITLAPIVFENPLEPVEARVEVCVSKRLRDRQWNLPLRAFRIDLGQRTAVNFERLARAAFAEVVVAFEAECDGPAALPRMTMEVVSAKRDPSGRLTDGRVHTEVTLRTLLHDSAGELVWQHETRGAVDREPRFGDGIPYADDSIGLFELLVFAPVALPALALQSPMLDRAAEDFADAVEAGLQQTFQALVAAAEIRNALEPGAPS